MYQINNLTGLSISQALFKKCLCPLIVTEVAICSMWALLSHVEIQNCPMSYPYYFDVNKHYVGYRS